MLKRRYLTKYVIEDLKEKMVFLAGPRQVGKTTLAKELIGAEVFNSYAYYNWDNRKNRQDIINSRWKDTNLLILDELHKYKKWKSFIKGEYDQLKESHKFLVTGSSKLDTYRKDDDSLLGRYHYYRLHPFSYSELNEYQTELEIFKPLNFSGQGNKELMTDLLHFGGFPEPFLAKSERQLRRWHKDRADRLFREDIRDLTRVLDLDNLRLFSDLLPDKVGSILSLNSIREDLEVSHKAVTNWMKILESFYVSFRIYPFQNNYIRALKKEPKMYLWDWSEVENEDAKFENFIAGHLLKLVHFLQDYEGYKADLFYLRDREEREVDFLIIIDKKPWFSVEVKLEKTDIPRSVYYFKEKLNIPYSYLVVKKENVDFTQNDIKVLSASKFLTAIP